MGKYATADIEVVEARACLVCLKQSRQTGRRAPTVEWWNGGSGGMQEEMETNRHRAVSLWKHAPALSA
ncbi:MAG: hypothetical protein AB9834_06310 [Lentimicrobium sp.]